MFKNFKNKISYLLIGLLIGCLFPMQSIFADQPIKLIINGQQIQCDVPPQNINGRVLVPARFVAENLGATVDWDGTNRAVIINSKVSQEQIQENNIQNNNVKITPENNNPKPPIDTMQKSLNNNIFIKSCDLQNIYDDYEHNYKHRVLIDVKNHKIYISCNDKSIYLEKDETYFDNYNNISYYSYNKLLQLFTSEQLNLLPHYTF